MRKVIVVVIAVLLFAPAAWACYYPETYTFNVSLVSKTVDDGRSGLLGFDNWYVWKYEVEVIDDGTDVKSGATLKHWVLELPSCYLASPDLFQEIETSAGWGRPDKVSVYDPEAVDPPDSETELSGMKWIFQRSCDPYSWPLGDQDCWNIDYDYFWFSVPTDVAIDTDWGVKAGKRCYSEVVTGTVDGPACPPSEVIPEPMSLVLMSTGIVGILIRKRRQRG